MPQSGLTAHLSWSQESPDRWDREVMRLGGCLLQSSTWGCLKSRHGWDPLWIELSDLNDTRLLAQVLFRRIGPFSVAYLPRGPVGDLRSAGVIAAFTVALDRACRERRALIAFAEPHVQMEQGVDLGGLSWESSRTELQPTRTIKVSVDHDDDGLLWQMKQKTRYNVRLAGRRGVTVRRGGLADLPQFYSMLQETSRRDQFGVHEFQYYEDVMHLFGERMALLIAEVDGEPAAGVIILRFGSEAVYLYGASRSDRQRDMPTYLVQYEAMRWARDEGCTSYDLWGIPASDEPPIEAVSADNTLNVRQGLWGVFRFKQGFGGQVVTYPGVFERVYARSLVNIWRLLKPGLI